MRIHDFPPEVVPMISDLSNAHLVPTRPSATSDALSRLQGITTLFFRMQKLPVAEKFAPQTAAGAPATRLATRVPHG
jgi:hypothetical protein